MEEPNRPSEWVGCISNNKGRMENYDLNKLKGLKRRANYSQPLS